jgi:hypothetical protein
LLVEGTHELVRDGQPGELVGGVAGLVDVECGLEALLRMPGVKGTRSSFIMQAVKSDLAWAPMAQRAKGRL